MKKNVWIISHDSVLDHRLFFFERYFIENNHNVTLIAGKFVYEGYSAFEKTNVLRPESKRTIYDFQASSQPHLDSENDQINLYICLKIIAKCADVFLRKRIRPSKSDFQKIFDKHFGKGSSALSLQEDRIYFRAKSHIDKCDFEFDSHKGKISKITPIEVADTSCHYIKDFDEHDFLANVYNYQPILQKIHQELDSGSLPRPDLIYVSDLPTLPIALEFKLKFGVPLVADCHEWWKEQYVIWGDGLKQKEMLFDKYERALYPKADLLITVGVKLAEYMSEYFGLRFNCIYTCDSIGFTRHMTQLQFWSGELQNYKGEKILLFQGSITPQRNIEAMVEIASELDDGILLIVVGAGSFTDKFLKLVKSKGAASKVRYLGWQNQERLLEFTHYADLGFIPYVAKSKYYGFGAPNKLFEFISAKLPIVYDESMLEIDYIVRGNSFGFSVDISKPKRAAASISAIIKNPKFLSSALANYELRGVNYFYEAQKMRFSSSMRGIVKNLDT